jgi:hypothetical protein
MVVRQLKPLITPPLELMIYSKNNYVCAARL